MVYDEALEFILGQKDSKESSSYFSFLRYSKNDGTLPNVSSDHYSYCYQTLLGWFKTQNKQWGCFYGNKLVPNFSIATNGEASDKQVVLENSVLPAFMQKNENLIRSVFEKIGNDINENKISYLGSNKNFELFENENNNNQINKDLNIYNENNKSRFFSFLQIRTNMNSKTRTFLRLNSEFKNHEEVVDRLNSLNLSWKAEAYSKFKDKTIKDLNSISGRKSKIRNSHRKKMSSKSFFANEAEDNMQFESNYGILYENGFANEENKRSKFFYFLIL
jgi:hypothetical protein